MYEIFLNKFPDSEECANYLSGKKTIYQALGSYCGKNWKGFQLPDIDVMVDDVLTLIKDK